MTTTVGLGETVNYKFTTSVNGVPTQLAGSPAVACYVGSSTTERTAGVTLTVDFDARTGLNNVAIVATSGNGYAAGERITLVLTAGTVGGYSVVGTVVGAFCVVPAMVYDALVDGTDTLQADVTQWLGTAAATPSVAGVPEVDLTHIAGSAVNTSSAQLGVNVVQAAGTAWGSGAITAGAIASNAITSAKIAANAIGASQIAAGAIDAATFAADVDAEILSYLVDDATKIDASALNTATGTTIPAILTDTAEIGAAGAGLTEAGGTGDHLTAVPWNAAWDAEVQSEAEDALVAHRLDELMNADSDIDGAAPPTVGSVVHELLSKTAGSFTFDQTTDSLEALRDRGDAAWLTATGFSTLDAAGVRSAMGLAAANLDTQLAALPTAAENADAVWDETRAGHVAAGSFGEGVASVQGNVTGSVASVTGAVGSVTGAVGSVTGAVGSVTGNVGGNVVGSVGSVTGNVGGSVASVVGNVGGNVVGSVDSVVGPVTVGTNNDKTGYAIGTGGIAAAAFAAGAIDASALNANAVDEILDEQIGDSTITVRQALKVMVASLAGKLSGALTTSISIRNVADDTNVIVATVDADGNRSAVTLTV